MTPNEKALARAMLVDAMIHATRALASFPEDPLLSHTPEYQDAIRVFKQAASRLTKG